jgi:hypothetical protein
MCSQRVAGNFVAEFFRVRTPQRAGLGSLRCVQQRLMDLRFRMRSAATLADLTVYLAAAARRCSLTVCGVPPRRARSRTSAQKCKNPTEDW